MSPAHALSKFIWRVAVAIVCMTTAVIARAQTPNANEIKRQIDRFTENAFVTCVSPAPDPHECRGIAYYAGPFSTSKLACFDPDNSHPISDCRYIVEMCTRNSHPFSGVSGKLPSPAEQQNGLDWQGLITFDYFASRERFIADNVWLAWSEWQDQKPPVAVASLTRKDGQWLVSDFRIMGRTLATTSTPSIGEELRTVISSSQPGTGELLQQPTAIDALNLKHFSCSQIFGKLEAPRTGNAVTIRRAAVLNSQAPGVCDLPQNTWVSIQSDMPWNGTAKVYVLRSPEGRRDISCSNPLTINRDDIEATKTAPRFEPAQPRAPGHSLADTYEQAQAIAQENVSKGIRDTISPSYLKARLPLFVCFAIDASGKCQQTGETIRVPGDLAQPLDWNKFSQPGACRPPQPDQIEVVLKSPASDDKRKRFIRCGWAAILASERKDLMALGVSDAGPTASTAAVIAPAATTQPPAPGTVAGSAELAPDKDAVTTRSFPDPRGGGPECGIAQGALVLVQSINSQTGKIDVFVLPNGKRDSRKCGNRLSVERGDLRPVEGYPSPK